MINSHKHEVKILYKIAGCRKPTDGCFGSFIKFSLSLLLLSLSSGYKGSIFSESNAVPHVFFLKSFSWKGPHRVTGRIKIINQILD